MKTTPTTPQRPNLLVILADDMGYSDIGCYGSEIRTPNLDRLARGGVRFSQMYNCARCCPTRASLLTGLYPHQTGVGFMVGDQGHPGYRGRLNNHCATIAEALKPSGYRTFLSGKWHVGGHYQANNPASWRPGGSDFPIPVERGFDEHYGLLGGAGSYFHPPYTIHNRELIQPDLERDGYYLTDDLSDQAVRMIGEARADHQPFFLYLAYTAPHWPLHAPAEDIERYRGRYRDGWDALRRTRHEKLKSLGILDSSWPTSPRDERAPAWEDVADKEWEDLRMAVYAAQVDRMDQGIGRVLDELERTNALDNTLILFLSDNGGCAEFLAEDSDKPEPMRYNIPLPDGRPMRCGNSPSIAPGPEDTFASYDLPWANASNTPFRLYKHWVHEGGIATPLIVHWPDAAPAGAIRHTPCHVIDIMATCLDAAGASYPTEFNGHAVTPLRGESLLPVLHRDRPRNQPIFFEHEGNCAVREGDWKLVRKHPGTWELYNMREDRTELHDLAAGEPERVRRLAALYDEYARTSQVLPWPIQPGTPSR